MNKNEQEQINSSCLMFANMAGLDFQRWHSDFMEFDRGYSCVRKD